MVPLPQGGRQEISDNVLECVVNVSEGADSALLGRLVSACGRSLLDVHSDSSHNRSVLTLGGEGGVVGEAARALAAAALELLDLRGHAGAHPRFGVVDVVPWVALEGWPLRDPLPGTQPQPCPERALQARDDFATWAADHLGLPVFLYGPERSLPEVRRGAWRSLMPDLGPGRPHPTAGSVAVGCRPLLVAYNLWLAQADLALANEVARAVRSPLVRALAFPLSDGVQVSCNLLSPLTLGPAAIWDEVSEMAAVEHAELVGLIPESVLTATPQERWAQLGLPPNCTIESRLLRTGHF